MPRRSRRASEVRRVPDARSESSRSAAGAGQRREQWRGVDFEVRSVLGSPEKVYRCPGCDQEIRQVSHVVVWPVYDVEAADRRHWHNVCWSVRERRAPVIERGRAAPRY